MATPARAGPGCCESVSAALAWAHLAAILWARRQDVVCHLLFALLVTLVHNSMCVIYSSCSATEGQLLPFIT